MIHPPRQPPQSCLVKYRRPGIAASLSLTGLLAGCSGRQSALAPAGEHSHRIGDLWWILLSVTAGVYVVILIFTLMIVSRRVRGAVSDGPVELIEAQRERRMKSVVGSALGLTTVILFALLIADFSAGRAMHNLQDPASLVLEVTGHRWWWEVKYKDSIPSNLIVAANEIHVPVGRSVKLELKSADVIHSFWAPNFNGKKDAIPGHSSTNWLRATRAGEFRGQCAEYCGHQHAHMRFIVVAEPEEQFNEWRRRASQPAREPVTEPEKRGQQVFLSGTCALCHTISGTSANATVGPNLTHVASRKLIGAASFENNPDTLRAWIQHPQHLKPGVLMPQQTLREDELTALVAYVGSLK